MIKIQLKQDSPTNWIVENEPTLFELISKEYDMIMNDDLISRAAAIAQLERMAPLLTEDKPR